MGLDQSKTSLQTQIVQPKRKITFEGTLAEDDMWAFIIKKCEEFPAEEMFNTLRSNGTRIHKYRVYGDNIWYRIIAPNDILQQIYNKDFVTGAFKESEITQVQV